MSLQKHRAILIQKELEHRILHGLACEWENALWILSSSDKEKLHKPLFSLRDMKNKWGFWSSERNEICLNRDFVLNHSWDSICEILLHEMAHQFAEQALGAHGEPPHGPKFRKACCLLRANPRASGNYKPLEERILCDSPEDKIMVRVKKLMALAQSQNQHEAEAAMAKAHEFIAKYNIDLLAQDEERHFVSVFVGNPALRHFREDYHLASLLLDFYFVFGIWVPAYVLEKGKMGRVLEINGSSQNIRIASYVHDFVQHFIDSRWNKYKRDKGLNRYRKTDFAVGIIQGFRSKLSSQTVEKKRLKCKFGLIKAQDFLLEKYIDHKYPRTTSLKCKALRGNIDVVEDGINLGKELVISKAITERATNRKLLIGKD